MFKPSSLVVYNVRVELASNLVWTLVSLVLIGGTWRAARADRLLVSRRSAFTLVALLCLLLLPVISLSDDSLEARQAQLPASAQTWHLASEGASTAVEIVPVLFACLELLIFAVLIADLKPERAVRRNPYAVWIAHVHSLRPPPAFAS